MILAKDLWGAMDYKFLQIEIADNVATVTINRPEVLNGLHPEAHSEMERIWEDLGSNEQVKVAILTCLLYTSPSPRDTLLSRMPSSA